ncbi:MAG: hypothetical protein K2J58_00190 [Muribaculaceae bacterium]|nr:hypothetical protein [Muribaculaceae bacterium]
MQLQLKRLFAIDTFSLLLFAMSILGILGHLPAVTNIIIQSIYVGITLLLTVSFIRRRAIGMVILKLAMLFILYFLNATVYVH